MKKTVLTLTLFTFFFCSKENNTVPNNNNLKEISYQEDFNDFPNPDRGFYLYTETKASNYTLLNEQYLINRRSQLNTNNSANYSVYCTLFFRYFVLDDFKNTPISSTFLNNLQQDFNIARNAGVKLIPRFVYSISANTGSCPEREICPPYGDTSKDIILNHIQQLTPVLNKNKDVITALQMGLIGLWGENYYTDYFGDPSGNHTQRKILDQNWNDRNEVLKALLDNLDKDILIQVRYPQLKQRYVYGINVSTTEANPISENEAFSGTDKARLGFHNDCFLANENDFGTYTDYGNSSTNPKKDIQVLKSYFEKDSKYVIVGGETCSDSYNPQNNCISAGGIAESDLRKLHYTYLNSSYNNDVNNDWGDGGCIQSIKNNLGYRIVLNSAFLTKKATKSSIFYYTLHLKNIGYASPMHKKNVFLVFENSENRVIHKHLINTDVRKWFSEIKIDDNFQLPSLLSSGKYNLYLQITDSNNTIANRPEYSIRLANVDTWNNSSGFNNLNHILTIE